MSSTVVLDNADNGTEAITHTKSKVVCCYVRSGSAEVIHDGDVIVTLPDPRYKRPMIDGLPIATTLTVRAIADGTTMILMDG